MTSKYRAYDDFFKTATAGKQPYPYQVRLATCDAWPDLLSIPTGVGKTASVILSWIYRRCFAAEEVQKQTPRRLIYCLPMRTLVEQTQQNAVSWIKNLGLDSEGPESVSVHQLMGGLERSNWDEHPERDAILIGTQDMLLSRALNRGYGMSRYRWPVHYALVSNDCQWIIDETQLMGVGLTTSSQLAGFRANLKTYGFCRTLWMSATLDAQALSTIDHPLPAEGWLTEELQDDDKANPLVSRLLTASKPCAPADTILSPESLKKGYETSLANEVISCHQAGTLTLVVANTVSRAQKILAAIQKKIGTGDDSPEIILVHSRFRPHDRERRQQQALMEDSLPAGGRILVATQAIEAGVDLSVTTLFTELAPWSSLVQRFGRANRRGTCGLDGNFPAKVAWVDIDTSDSKGKSLAMPYDEAELDLARRAIKVLQDVGPETLSTVDVKSPSPIVHVIRRKDLLDLFDTTADLSGNDLDVSRYIREGDDSDVQVYWRDWNLKNSKGKPPDPKGVDGAVQFAAPVREELCSVSVSQLREFVKALRKNDKTKHVTWCWNPLAREWEECRESHICPGSTILLHVTASGYDEILGWTGDVKQGPVRPVTTGSEFTPVALDDAESMDADETGTEQVSLAQHLRDVGKAAEELKKHLNVDVEVPWSPLIRAAWWHDVGKAHPAFQGALRRLNPELNQDQVWAKSGGQGRLVYTMPDGTRRRGFRHELASALAWLSAQNGSPDADLVAFLIASHHGKVRMSIRSMPNENRPENGQLYARGIWDQDELPRVEIGNEQQDISPECQLSLSLMKLGEEQPGQASWLARSLGLREKYGPFRLAYLEALLRVADWRGSTTQVKS